MEKVRFGKARTLLRGKGFAIAMAFSIAAIGGATYIAYDSAMSKITVPVIPGVGSAAKSEIVFGDGKPVDNVQENVPKANPSAVITPPPAVTAADAGREAMSAAEAEQAGIFAANKPKKVMPADGAVINEFSKGELVKSKTLGVWKTHDGIDIAAAENSPVISVTKGTVNDVFADPLWGVCVSIDYGDGNVGCYFGLKENVTVVAGQEVETGEVIGYAGKTAEIEAAEEPHLHFAVRNGETWIDPMEFLNN